MPREEQPHIWSVTELNGAVRDLLEGTLVSVWVGGEVGNLALQGGLLAGEGFLLTHYGLEGFLRVGGDGLAQLQVTQV